MGLTLAAGLTLDNGLRPQAIAGVAPTLDYRFARDKREIEAVSLTDKLTYTGGNGTFVGSDGFIQRATTNVPRFDHDPLSRVSEGLLVEGSRQNLLLRSEEFNDVGWVKSGIAGFGGGSIANAVIAPDGTLSADLIADDGATNANHFVTRFFTCSDNAQIAASVYAKAGTTPYVRIRVQDKAGTGGRAWYDLSNGTVTAVDPGYTALDPVNVGNGWYRLVLIVPSIVSGATAPGLQIFTQSESGSQIAYTGNGSSLYIWGAQLEENASTPSTYIPTTSTAVTRTADSATIDGTGVLAGTYTMVAKPEGCAQVSGSTIVLQPGYTAERVMVFPAALSAAQITAIREAM